jgi:hypothetical protein
MKMRDSNSAEDQLSALLHEGRPAPELPPRFRDNVWRRLESTPVTPPALTWVEMLATLVLRPRFAFAAVGGLVLAGVLLGAVDGNTRARHEAQERYVAAVAMPILE